MESHTILYKTRDIYYAFLMTWQYVTTVTLTENRFITYPCQFENVNDSALKFLCKTILIRI
jgi:hypothetical protein